MRKFGECENVPADTFLWENLDKVCGNPVQIVTHVSHVRPRTARQSSHTRNPNGRSGTQGSNAPAQALSIPSGARVMSTA